MQKVTLITGLKKEFVQKMHGRDYVEYRSFNPEEMIPIRGSDDVLVSDTFTVRTFSVPIFRLCQHGRDDVYIAYSEEVENDLGIPIRTILGESERRIQMLKDNLEIQRKLREKVKKTINGYGFIKRLRYLVTGWMEESSWS